MGTQRGATGIGNSARNLNKNLYLGIPTGSFNTIAVGPLATNNYELSFYYKQTDYESPFNPLTNWGNLMCRFQQTSEHRGQPSEP
ncbi:hypothetical protein ACFOEQ_09040 [Chryseobacterium arachidis]|uniref:hypothetical protein n=1 Tax=Chryseobacterium arachidis TaxID=1416778 RepID=UPI00361BE2C4